MKIYLDVCCLNRPFDDQTQDRIRLESEAVLIILNRLGNREWEWVSSNVVDYDAFHIACAERSGCAVFLTTDDRLLAKVVQNAEKLHLQVHNPLDWINKVVKE